MVTSVWRIRCDVCTKRRAHRLPCKHRFKTPLHHLVYAINTLAKKTNTRDFSSRISFSPYDVSETASQSSELLHISAGPLALARVRSNTGCTFFFFFFSWSVCRRVLVTSLRSPNTRLISFSHFFRSSLMHNRQHGGCFIKTIHYYSKDHIF